MDETDSLLDHFESVLLWPLGYIPSLKFCRKLNRQNVFIIAQKKRNVKMFFEHSFS